jgi:hypothetical protein
MICSDLNDHEYWVDADKRVHIIIQFSLLIIYSYLFWSIWKVNDYYLLFQIIIIIVVIVSPRGGGIEYSYHSSTRQRGEENATCCLRV